MKDWRETPIEVGSKVVYPGRQGSSLWMIEGEVVEMAERESWDGKTYPVLQVKRLREAWWGKTQVVDPKVVTLGALDRVTVV